MNFFGFIYITLRYFKGNVQFNHEPGFYSPALKYELIEVIMQSTVYFWSRFRIRFRERPLMTSDIRVGKRPRQPPKQDKVSMYLSSQVKNGQKTSNVINGSSLKPLWQEFKIATLAISIKRRLYNQVYSSFKNKVVGQVD